ncbi:MAG: hypothetical protein QNJ94_18460 [Alphaproteobacteria bacterium]|nr:hypothetical protein [Alphaproteobacteria bacterium]
MVWRFLKHYGINKATDALEEFTAAVVAFDPQAASAAQISMMEAELGKLGTRLAEAEAEVRREHQETIDLKESYQQHLQAAQILEQNLAQMDDGAAKAETEASLAKLIDKLEHLKPEIEREEREDREVEAWRAELRSSFEQLAGKVRSARAELSSARRRMDMAQLQKERALESQRRTMDTAGLASTVGSLSVALDSMNRETAKVRAETEALKLKAEVLQVDRLDSDPNIAAALAEARGKQALGRGSLSERLATLNGGGKGPTLVSAA